MTWSPRGLFQPCHEQRTSWAGFVRSRGSLSPGLGPRKRRSSLAAACPTVGGAQVRAPGRAHVCPRATVLLRFAW